MSTYKITLTPTGKFFFGGEMKFELDGKEDKNDAFSSYIIKSKQLPQQTSLLGMLRFLILRNEDKAFKNDSITDKALATELIGKQSFMVNEGHNKGNFGKINFITPCEIEDNKGKIIEKQTFVPLEAIKFDNKEATINGRKINIPEIKDFDAKKGTNPLYKGIFEEDTRNGISKDYSGTSKENAYYMQVSYRMKDQQKFVFYADVDLDITSYDGQIVNLGADSSSFIIKIKQEQIPAEGTKGGKFVVLTSPTYLDAEDTELACYAITKTEPFRFLKTGIDTKSYNRLSGEVKQSGRIDLYSAGSVFCFENEEKATAFGKAIEAKKEFKQIGYNYYRTK